MFSPANNDSNHHVGSSKTPIVPPSSPSSIAASPYWAPGRIPFSEDDNETSSSSGFSPLVAFCFTINMMIGTGFLTIPWAFIQSGVILSTIVMLVVFIFADIVKDYILETMARAEAMLDTRMHWIKNNNNNNNKNPTSDNEQGLLLVESSPILWGPTTSTTIDEKKEEQRPQPQPVNVGQYYYGATTTTTKLLLKPPGSYSSLTTLGVVSPLGTPVSGSVPNSPSSLYNNHDRSILLKRIQQQQQQQQLAEHNKYVVKHRKFEINTLCRVFLGKTGLHVYTLFAALYLYGCTWAYTSVFASAMASAAPTFAGQILSLLFASNNNDNDDAYDISHDYYAFYTIVFGCIVVPLTCMELKEQVTLQVILSACRFLIILLMVGTSSLCAAATSDNASTNNESVIMEHHHAIIESSSSTSSAVPMFRPSGLHKTVPILVMAAVFHHSLPSLSEPVANKKKLGSIFRSTCVFCAIAYSLIGFVLGSTFGERIEQSANLNWQGIVNGCTNPTLTDFMDDDYDNNSDNRMMARSFSNNHCVWTKPMSLFIICFPALDVISGFPLNSITLGNSLMGAYYGDEIHEAEKNRWKKIPFRLLGSIPPIIFGLIVRELGVITDYTGTIGFIITFTFPALLYLQSKKIAIRKKFSTDTYYFYSTLYSYVSSYANIIANMLCWFGIIMVLYVIIVMITS